MPLSLSQTTTATTAHCRGRSSSRVADTATDLPAPFVALGDSWLIAIFHHHKLGRPFVRHHLISLSLSTIAVGHDNSPTAGVRRLLSLFSPHFTATDPPSSCVSATDPLPTPPTSRLTHSHRTLFLSLCILLFLLIHTHTQSNNNTAALCCSHPPPSRPQPLLFLSFPDESNYNQPYRLSIPNCLLPSNLAQNHRALKPILSSSFIRHRLCCTFLGSMSVNARFAAHFLCRPHRRSRLHNAADRLGRFLLPSSAHLQLGLPLAQLL